jgi:hypothetical protein
MTLAPIRKSAQPCTEKAIRALSGFLSLKLRNRVGSFIVCAASTAAEAVQVWRGEPASHAGEIRGLA